MLKDARYHRLALLHIGPQLFEAAQRLLEVLRPEAVPSMEAQVVALEEAELSTEVHLVAALPLVLVVAWAEVVSELALLLL